MRAEKKQKVRRERGVWVATSRAAPGCRGGQAGGCAALRLWPHADLLKASPGHCGLNQTFSQWLHRKPLDRLPAP
ncbi:hypothetical protein Cadr_000012632 [Camelus dromedarius]|uniref:Uncharacterized protein n=1 Tax=Camelus dromedarius TaxID=9838 RepID=A0A5N4D8S2_CAMDR|nr:hypothetical protein Cadr_000012632 [Camelus dromedarius]